MLADILADIAWHYMEVQAYIKAEKYIIKAMTYAPDNLNHLQTMVQLYRVSGQFDKELETIERMISISPLNTGLVELGIHYYLVADYANAVKYFGEYYTKASETANAGTIHQNHNYAYSLMKLGRLVEAKARLGIALDDVKKKNLTPHYEYAKIYMVRGNVDSTYYHLEQAISGPIHWGMADHMEDDRIFEDIKDQPEFIRLVTIAKEKVRVKREEIHRLEEAGIIPKSVEEVELY